MNYKRYVCATLSISALLMVSCSSGTKKRSTIIATDSGSDSSNLQSDTGSNSNANLNTATATTTTATTTNPVTPVVVPPNNQVSTNQVWNPFNTSIPGGSDTIELSTFQVGGISFVAWGQQRCTSVGDSLPPWGGGAAAVAGTAEGRFRWAEARASQYAQYYQIARNAVDVNGNRLPLYPAFGIIGASGAITLPSGAAPTDPASAVTALASGYQLFAFCVPSCFRGDQALIFASEQDRQKYLAMKDAEALFKQAPRSFEVATLDPSSTLGSPQTRFARIGSFVTDMKVPNPKAQMFYEFITEMDHSLTVTENHGMLLSSGDMRSAKDISDRLDAGQEASLLNASGKSERVLKVNKMDLPELSYNMRVENKSGESAGHVLVSKDGLLSADAHLQDQLGAMSNNLNESLDRENIPLEVLPR